MNERTKELAEQAGLKFSKDWGECYTGNVQIERFAELVRQDERQAIAEAEKESTLQEISDFGHWDTSDMAHRPNGLAIDDDDIQEYKKPWVGLTDEEIAQVVGSPLDEVYLTDFRRVIAKLKEKHNG
jgi:hypothetical protein